MDAGLIPTGELRPVAGTPFDFTKSTAIGARIDADDEQIKLGHGYDHNWVLDATGGKVALAAEVFDPTTGRVLQVLTDQPGIQFYTGNFLDGTVKGKGGVSYGKRSALCLETQHFPDSPNHPDFPTTELKPRTEVSHGNGVQVFCEIDPNRVRLGRARRWLPGFFVYVDRQRFEQTSCRAEPHPSKTRFRQYCAPVQTAKKGHSRLYSDHCSMV